MGGQFNAKGNNLRNVSRLLVYATNRSVELPAAPARPTPSLAPPAATAPPERVARGEAVYRVYCGRCHGAGTENFGILPDLRYSAALSSSQTWAAVVLGGVLKQNGMPSFTPVLDADAAEAIRAYVIVQANAAARTQNLTRR
jgi:quinohemoprotein ethanol dehydrogenase